MNGMVFFINNFLLAGEKFMSKMHLIQPGFTYSAFGPFKKSKERILKFKETRDQLDKPFFQHDITYGDFKDLTRRTASHKILDDKTFNIAKI